MFLEPNGNPHPLPHNPVKALVAPRPIGWISTLSETGVANLAPYSFFNLIADAPFMVMFATSGHKDSFRNVQATGEFVWNLVNRELADAMNRSAAHVPAGVDEFALAGLTKAPSKTVAAPRVAEAKAALECRLDQIVPLKSTEAGRSNSLVIATVTQVYINDAALDQGLFDVAGVQSLARLGYMDYAAVETTFRLDRPD
jgi:flavin reductase (DIM6/NTAB) family NADH-FMN oxidoreductase RutF